MEEGWRLTGVRRVAWKGDWGRQRGEEERGGQWRKKKVKTHGRIVGGHSTVEEQRRFMGEGAQVYIYLKGRLQL